MNSHQYHALTDDGTDAWPSSHLRRAIEKKSTRSPISGDDDGMEAKPKLCVLLTTGAMNPIHRGHIAMLTHAKLALERHHGFTVVAGYVSPSHDRYVGPKMRAGGQAFVNAEERVAMCTLAVKEIDWLHVGTWEARQLGRWPDYPEVLDDLTKHVLGLSSSGATQDIIVFYVCGTDHARYCGDGFRHPNKGLMVISRMGDPHHPTDVGRLVFGAGASTKDVEALSSSGVRAACKYGNVSQLHSMLHHDVAVQIMRRGMYKWKRTVFISASALARAWRRAESEADAECDGTTSSDSLNELRAKCDASLFFFGSKRSWLFPGSEAELVESRRQGRYEPPYFPAALTALVRVKESRTPSEVYFLKPPSLEYKGFGKGCHPPDPLAPAFHNVSAWLESHGLKPLLLTRRWWLTDKRGYAGRESRTGSTARNVVENYEIGEHDYGPCIELLYQSDHTLDPVLDYSDGS